MGADPDTERCGSRPACAGRDSATKQGSSAAPLVGTPFRFRGHCQSNATKGKPEFPRRRSDLFFASSDSRLARNQTTIFINNFPHQPMPAQWPWPPASPAQAALASRSHGAHRRACRARTSPKVFVHSCWPAPRQPSASPTSHATGAPTLR